MEVKSKLTVYFEEPFWVGTFERTYNGEYQVSRLVFGPEPKDYDVYELVLDYYNNIKYSKPIPEDEHEKKRINPKRLQRKIRKELQNTGVGTKAQQAMKLQYENQKIVRKKRTKKNKENEKLRKFQLKQKKKKEKHKGH